MPKTYGTKRIMASVKEAIRQPYAWPGGYLKVVVLGDGALLCPKCARAEYKQIVWATMHGLKTGWEAIAVQLHYEDPSSPEDAPETCAHCNNPLGDM